jgi:hypothetical protein
LLEVGLPYCVVVFYPLRFCVLVFVSSRRMGLEIGVERLRRGCSFQGFP